MSSITITHETISGWKADLEDARSRASWLERRIAAAELLLDGAKSLVTEPPISGQSKPDQPRSAMTLVDAIIGVLEASGSRPLTNDEIKDRLPTVGFDASSMHRNYYYTATKRLTEKGSIVKHEDGTYSLPKENEPPKGGSDTGEGDTSPVTTKHGNLGDLLGSSS